MGFLILGHMGKARDFQIVTQQGNPVPGKTAQKPLFFEGQGGDKGPAQGNPYQGAEDKKAPVAFPPFLRHPDHEVFLFYRQRGIKEVDPDTISGQGFQLRRVIAVIGIPVMLIDIGIFQDKGKGIL
jgi:hypothetical protein